MWTLPRSKPALLATAALWCGGAALSALEPPTLLQTRASARLEAIGVERTGQLFVRMVAATHRPIVDLFLDSGIDINALGHKGRSALLAAILVRDWATAERLLAAGADPQRGDENGFTPLMGAALSGHLRTIRALLAKGALPTVIDCTGHNAVHYAIDSHQREIVEALLPAGDTLPVPTPDTKDLLDHALDTRERAVIDPILARTPRRVSWSPEACAALSAALEADDCDLARQLIAKHQSPPAPTAGAQPLLAYTIARGDTARLGALLTCGVDPNAILSQKPDPAFAALIGTNFLRFYVEKEPGLTPLMLAAGLGRVDCVKALLAGGADRRQASSSRTQLLPLYFAAWAECPEAIQLLLGTNPPDRAHLRVEVDLRRQRATLFQNGVPAFSTAISSGKGDKPTPAGEFVITDKHRDHRSSIYQNASMPFFMRLSCRDFGLHQGYVTGRPASHGCIRLPEAAARKLYQDLPIGTWVSVMR